MRHLLNAVITIAVSPLLLLPAASNTVVKPAPEQPTPAFVAPDKTRSLPPIRVSGTSRSYAEDCGGAFLDTQVSVLSPERPGLTSSQSPKLYWYISNAQPAGISAQIVVADTKTKQAVFKDDITSGIPVGIRTIDLAAKGVALNPGAVYSIKVVLRCKDVDGPGAQGGVVFDPEGRPPVDCASSDCKFDFAARNGIWHDAMDAAFGANATPRTRRLGFQILREVELEGITDASGQ